LISFIAIESLFLKGGMLMWIKPLVAFRQASIGSRISLIALWNGCFRMVMLTICHAWMIDPATVARKCDETSPVKTFLSNTLNKSFILLSVGWQVAARHRGFLGLAQV